MHIVIEYYVYVSVCVRVQLGETVTWIYLGSSSWTAMVPRFNVLTSTLDLRILEDMWYAKHCSSTVSGKAACVQVIKRYQKTVGLLIVQDGFSWCFSWCLQPLNVDSCQFYDPLFSLSLSLFLISSFSWLTLCQKCLGCRISCQHGTRNAKTTSYKKLSNGKRKAYIFRAATAFPMSDDVRTAFSQAGLEYDQFRFLRKMGYLQGLQDHFCDSYNATQPRTTKRILEIWGLATIGRLWLSKISWHSQPFAFFAWILSS